MFYISAKKGSESLPDCRPASKDEAISMHKTGATLVMPDRRFASNRKTPHAGRKHVCIDPADEWHIHTVHLVASLVRSGQTRKLGFAFERQENGDLQVTLISRNGCIDPVDPHDPDLRSLLDLIGAAVTAWADLLRAQPAIVMDKPMTVDHSMTSNRKVGEVPPHVAQIVRLIEQDPGIFERIASKVAEANAEAEAEKDARIAQHLRAWADVPMGTYLAYFTNGPKEGYPCAIGRLVAPLIAGEHLEVEILEPRHKDMIMALPGVSMHRKLDLVTQARQNAEAFPDLLEPYHPHPRERSSRRDPDRPRIPGYDPFHTSWHVPEEEWHGSQNAPDPVDYAWWMGGPSPYTELNEPFGPGPITDPTATHPNRLIRRIQTCEGRFVYKGKARTGTPRNDMFIAKDPEGSFNKYLLVSPRMRKILEAFDLSCVTFHDIVIAGHPEGSPDITGWSYMEVAERVSGLRPHARHLVKSAQPHIISRTDPGVEFFELSYQPHNTEGIQDDDLAVSQTPEGLPDVWRARDFRPKIKGALFFSDRLVAQIEADGLCRKFPRVRARVL